MRVHARLERTLYIFVKGVGGHGDNGNLLRVGALQGADRSSGLKTVHHRHAHIHEDRVVVADIVIQEHVDGSLTVLGALRFDALHIQKVGEDLGVEVDILRHQHAQTLQRDLILRGRGFRLRLCFDRLNIAGIEQNRVQLAHDVVREERLGHDAHNPQGLNLIPQIVPVVTGQKNDGGLAAVEFADGTRKLQAGHAGHTVIRHQELIGHTRIPFFTDAFERVLRAEGSVGSNADIPQDELRMLKLDLVVVHDHNTQTLGQRDGVGLAYGAAGGFERDRDGKGGAEALLAFHGDIAVHHFHQILGDGHAEAGAAVTVGRAGVLLGKGLKDLRNVFLAHTDAGVLDDKAHHAVVVKPGGLFDRQGDAAALGGELDGIAENVDQHLLELHIVADIVVVYMADDAAVIVQPLVRALAVDDDVDLIQEHTEGEFLFLQRHSAGLDAAHIQDIVDEAQQMLGAGADFLKLLPGTGREVRILQGNVVQADDGVHGGADLVAHVGQKAGLGAAGFLGEDLFALDLLFAAVDDRGDVEQRDHRDHHKGDLDEAVLGEGIIEPVNLFIDHLLRAVVHVVGMGNAVFLEKFHIVLVDVVDGLRRCGVGGLAHPDEGAEQRQRQHDDPHDGGTAHVLRLIPQQQEAEGDQAQHAPQREDKIGLMRQRGDGQQVRHQIIQQQDQREGHADQTGDFHDPVVHLPRGFQRGGGDIGVGDRRADRCHVHDPADCRAAEKRDEDGDPHDEKDGVFRNTALVEPAERGGHHALQRHGVDQAAGGNGIAHNAGDDSAQNGKDQNRRPDRPQRARHGIEDRRALKTVQTVLRRNVLRPVVKACRENGGRDDGQRHIGECAGDKRQAHDGQRPFHRETEFPGGVGDGLKAHKGPGAHRDDGKHAYPGLPAGGEGGRVGGKAALMIPKDRRGANKHARAQKQRHRDLHSEDNLPAGTKQAEENQRTDGKQQLAQIDVKAGDLIMQPKLEDVSQQEAADQRQGGGVGPDDGDVGEQNKPRRNEAVIRVEGVAHKAERAAVVGIELHHVMVVDAHDQHDQGADQKAERRPQRAGYRKKAVAGHHEGTPADSTAEGKRPRAERGYAAGRLCAFLNGFGGCVHVKSGPFESIRSRIPRRQPCSYCRIPSTVCRYMTPISAILALTSSSESERVLPGRNSSVISPAAAAILSKPILAHTPFMAWALSKRAVGSMLSPAAASAS